MTSKPLALIVAPTHVIASRVFACMADAGWIPVVVASFPDAKQHLKLNPSLMIAEVRLGEYNGLHLALRAQGRGIAVVVLGEGDSVLQREAEELGAAYLPPDVDAQRLLASIHVLIPTMRSSGDSWQETDAPLPPTSKAENTLVNRPRRADSSTQ